MDRLINKDLQDILNLIYISNQHLDLVDMRKDVLDGMVRALNVQGAVFFLADSMYEDIDFNSAVSIDSDEFYVKRFSEIHRLDPFERALYMDVITTKVDNLLPYSSWVKHPFYNDFCRPQNIYHKMAVFLRSGNKFYGVIGLCRPKEQPNFSSRDMLFCNILAPHLTTTLQNISLYSEIFNKNNLNSSITTFSSAGILLLDNKLRFVSWNHKAAEYCCLMSNGFMNESCLKSDDSFAIPQEILQDCLALAKLNKSGAQIVPLSFHRTININQNKKLHVKTCVISQSFNSASAFNFLVTMDYLSKIHECNEIVLRERYRLTRREAEIIELVSQGLSNNEISSELYISRSTVETHIKNIYQKMGIKNRVTLSNLIQFG